MANKRTMPPQSAADAEAMAMCDTLLKGGVDPMTTPQEQKDDPEANGGKMTPPPMDADLAKCKGMKKADEGDPAKELEKGKDEDEDEMEKGDDEDEDDEEAKGKKAKGKDDDEDEDEGDEDEEKSITDEDLMKAVEAAQQIAEGNHPKTRRAELMQKAQASTLEKSERAELIAMLEADEEQGDEPGDLEKSFTMAALSDPDIEAGHTASEEFDVSGFLARLAQFVGGGLDQVSGELHKGFENVAQYNRAQAKAGVALAKAISKQHELVKSLTERIDALENQPMPRRSIPTARALNKSFAGQPEIPPRHDLVKGLNMLMRQSPDGRAPGGWDIAAATCHLETTGEIAPAILAEVKKTLGSIA